MKVTIVEPRDLDGSLTSRWLELQRSNAGLQSPYFMPQFTQAVAEVRRDVQIAVLEDGAAVVGLFPFQRGAWGGLAAVGGLLSDRHGVVASPHTSIRFQEILSAAKLLHWRFDHLVATQAPPDAAALLVSASPALDLSGGFSAYKERRNDSRRIADLDRKARKLAREVGPLRFEARSASAAELTRVVAWKSAQCRRTGVLDYFSELPWTRALIERIHALHAETSPAFSGALSLLYAGDALVAANMGMRSEGAWHWWFPVYDHAYAKYSPGALLLLRVAEAAADAGVAVLDLGKGDAPYKESFADLKEPIVEGFIARSPALTIAECARRDAERWVKSSSLLDPIKPALRSVKRFVARSSSTA